MGSLGRLEESLGRATTSLVTRIVGVLLVLVFGWGVRLVAGVWRADRALRRATTIIKTPGPDGDSPTRVGAALGPVPVFGEVWRSFAGRLFQLDGQWRAQRPFSELVTEATVADRAGAAAASRIPTALTTLGLLGTFLGIAEALARIAQSGSLDEQANNLSDAIPGLAAAFWTSIFGIVLALFFGRFANWREEQLRNAVVSLRESVDTLIPALASEEVLVRQLDVLRETREHAGRSNEGLRQVVDRIHLEAEEARSLLQTIATDLPETLGRTFRSALADHVQPSIERLQESLDARLSDLAGDSAEAARSFATDFAEGMSGQLTASLQSMGQSIERFGGGFEAMSARLDSLGDMVSGVMKSHSGSLAETQAVLLRAKEQASASAAVVHGIDAALLRLNATLQSTEHARGQTDALVTRQAEQQARAMEVTGGLVERLEVAARAYGETAAVLAPLVREMGTAVEALAASVTRASAASETAGERLGGVATQLGARIQKETELVATYGRAVADMDGALGRARPTLDRLAQASGVVHEAAGRFQSVSETVKVLVDRLAVAGEALRTQLTTAATALEGAGTKLQGAAGATDAWAEEARKAIEKFGAETRRVVHDSLHSFDEALSGAVKALSASMKELEDLAEEIASHRRAEGGGAGRPGTSGGGPKR